MFPIHVACIYGAGYALRKNAFMSPSAPSPTIFLLFVYRAGPLLALTKRPCNSGLLTASWCVCEGRRGLKKGGVSKGGQLLTTMPSNSFIL